MQPPPPLVALLKGFCDWSTLPSWIKGSGVFLVKSIYLNRTGQRVVLAHLKALRGGSPVRNVRLASIRDLDALPVQVLLELFCELVETVQL